MLASILVLRDTHLWPEHANPQEALVEETRDWGPRLDTAMRRYDELDGELPSALSKLAIGIVDGDESRDNFSMVDIYGTWEAEPDSFGALLLVNYLGKKPPRRTRRLVDTIRKQHEATGVPTAISLVGYESRRTDQLRDDVWDIGVSHALHHSVTHPIIGISNDADMLKTSPDYFPNMTSNEHVDAPATVWGTDIQFSLPGDPNLLLNRTVKYLYRGRQSWWEHSGAPMITYGASMAMRLDTYAAARSWGDGDPSDPMGRGEPVTIVRNIGKRATGQADTTRDGEPSLQGYARRVEGMVEVSGRRELLRFATTFLKRSESFTPDPFTTSGGRSSYRRYSYETLEGVAKLSTRRIKPPALLRMLDIIDKSLLGALSEESQREKLKADLRAAREEFDLPSPHGSMDLTQ